MGFSKCVRGSVFRTAEKFPVFVSIAIVGIQAVPQHLNRKKSRNTTEWKDQDAIHYNIYEPEHSTSSGPSEPDSQVGMSRLFVNRQFLHVRNKS